MMRKLEGKTALITGASSGVGKQTAIRFAEEGANLILCSRTEAKLMTAAGECEQRGAKVVAVPTDVMEYASLEKLVQTGVEVFGTIDILANDAVTLINGSPHPFLEHGTDELDVAISSGLYATWHLMKLCFPYMKENGGSIINFGSGAGRSGQEGYAAYAATKEAIRGLSRVVAREWGQYNIRVNVICPFAMTETIKYGMEYMPSEQKEAFIGLFSQNPLKRPGECYEDIAPAMVFLASDDSRWITGQTLNVEGGGDIHC